MMATINTYICMNNISCINLIKLYTNWTLIGDHCWFRFVEHWNLYLTKKIGNANFKRFVNFLNFIYFTNIYLIFIFQLSNIVIVICLSVMCRKLLIRWFPQIILEQEFSNYLLVFKTFNTSSLNIMSKEQLKNHHPVKMIGKVNYWLCTLFWNDHYEN